MSKNLFLFAFCVFNGFAISVVTLAISVADEPRKIIGRIIDERNIPIENVTIAETWKSLEPEASQTPGGNSIPLTPRGKTINASDSSGKFELENQNSSLGFLAIDSRGERGAIVYWHTLKESAINEIRLGQLTQINCRIPKQFQSKDIDRVYLTLCLKALETHPLENTRLVYISGVSDNFNFKLPPGSYRLLATAITKGNPVLELGLVDDVQFTINGQTALELGELPLRVYTDPALAYTREIKALHKRDSISESESRTKLFGQIAPNWVSVDGSGLDHRANIEALRGKWVLLEFWGLNCVPCLREGIPALNDFYERNKRHQDRFEIVGLYLDFSGKVNSVASLEKELEPIKKNVWGGKGISFPIVIANTVANWERYAIQGLGDYLLIDPDGRVTRGDLSTLQKVLDGN